MTEFDVQVSARTLCQEARGEPPEGQEAVAWVLRNRLSDGRWGACLASVCLWHGQFSGWYSPRGNPPKVDPNFAYACNLRDDDPMLLKMRALIEKVMAAPATDDPTNKAMWYYADFIQAPAWTDGAISCGKFGTQFFWRGVQ